MATFFGPYDAGTVAPEPGQTIWYFWDVPDGLPDNLCTWTVTAVPRGVNPEFEAVPPEQRVQVVEMFLLRKGPDSTVPNQLQLNYAIRNNGQNPVNATVIILAIGPSEG